MVYAQFYHKSVPYTLKGVAIPSRVIEAVGDRGVIILDGRQSVGAMKGIAFETATTRGFCGFRLFGGLNFLRSRAISDYISVV